MPHPLSSLSRFLSLTRMNLNFLDSPLLERCFAGLLQKKDVSPGLFLKCLERGCSIALVVISPISAFLAVPEIEHGV